VWLDSKRSIAVNGLIGWIDALIYMPIAVVASYFMTNEINFQLEGEFLGVCALDGYKLKYLQLRTAERDVIVKIPKELRLGMVYQLVIGDLIRCEGIQKDVKFKASVIEKIDRVAALPTSAAPANESKVKILICQKSHCRNNGGKEVYSALTEQLNSYQLNDSVTLQPTGCLKCCKKAPSLVVSAVGNRSRYHDVKISQVAEIVSNIRYHLISEQN
jgi:(2Fe-2S) ferredoxin